ncbi:sugar O-acetyltransferase [Rhodococcus rhodnii]|uniref:Acetyltransferase n=2 Tax=Rhodococcus rhodnii TaxID=38312 RepID=R7WTE7_9NOCA|nr:sugar O-acetyltransferase [Rhodococcus rhodnii]EOM78556.1 acetyltransferase [Rhodococcus rhodnii LMG 5362]TXG91343.1 sugar O-acetyltransferase [Rhodococcus rhodnii]
MGEDARRLARGEWYLDDAELQDRRRRCARLLDSFDSVPAEDDRARSEVLRAVVGEVGDGVVVVPRFRCSYGDNIRLGDGVFVNAGAFFMDDAPITLAPNVRIGPGAQLMTALHPVDDHARRREGWERAAPITIGENAWLGAAVTVGAGVTIGRNAVIGAGSVVLRDVPDHVVAAGSPAVVVRHTPVEG